MKLIFLGSGSAFTTGEHNYHSNMLLADDKQNRLLIDCGSDARFSLNQHGLSHADITDVYISHIHADHTGGLEWLAFTSKFVSDNHRKPILHASNQILDILWESALSGGLKSIEGEIADLSTYFNIDSIDSQNKFTWNSLELQLIQTEHVLNGKEWMPSFGLFFKVQNITCFITTDSRFDAERYMRYYQQADIIFQDCETAKYPTGVHPHYQQLVTLDPAIKAKMWLYHYNPGCLPDAKSDGFRGFVTKGQCFDFSDMKTLI